jgi:hypothetical protein
MAKYASLHAGLLARKGEAAPAVPPGFTGAGHADNAAPRQADRRDVDLTPAPQPLFARKPPDRPERDEDAGPGAKGCCGARPGPGEDPHAGVDRAARAEVRLTAEQKRRLRTVAVQMNWPQQRILSDALDAWLAALCAGEMRNCSCLRARPEDGATR